MLKDDNLDVMKQKLKEAELVMEKLQAEIKAKEEEIELS